jgi:ABC-type multidrug transport system fused ATPase/permease subunit
VNYLVVPRFLAGLVMLPVLTASDVVGMAGVRGRRLRATPAHDSRRSMDFLDFEDILPASSGGGLGVIIAIVGCHRASTPGRAEGAAGDDALGRALLDADPDRQLLHHGVLLLAMAEPMISLRGISKRFGQHQVLEGLDLEIERGETMVVIGGSGTGKSVLLKHIIGLLRPDAGEVVVDGVAVGPLRGWALKEFRKKFGMLFQGSALFDSLSVLDNVAFGLREQPA